MTSTQNISVGQIVKVTGGMFRNRIVNCKILDVQKNRYYASYKYGETSGCCWIKKAPSNSGTKFV